MSAIDALDQLFHLFRSEDIESLASAFYRGHLDQTLLWLVAQP